MPEFLRGADPFTIRWSDTFTALRAAAPTISITTWCFEDMPILWTQIIREMAGFEREEKIIGGFDLLSKIMSKEGMQRLESYIASHPNMPEMQKRKVISVFLDKYASKQKSKKN